MKAKVPFAVLMAIVALGILLRLASPLGRSTQVVAEEVPAPVAEKVAAAAANEIVWPADRGRYVGTAGCAAGNCHGGGGDRARPVGSEYSLWIQSDPHAQAYAVLFNSASREIARRLGIPAAHEAATCLNCHSINAPAEELAADHRHALHDGVGCEACHGPAEKWLAPHHAIGWKTTSPEAKEALGFRDTSDLVTRARVCAECHVGSPGRDVNHDLIAAGHPRMFFELSAYHANLPRHWDRKRDLQENSAALEARLWQIGQAVSASAAVGLTVQRAKNEQAPWPEFAEYGCFACHHELRSPSWRQEEGYAGRRPGELPWGAWTMSPLTSDLALLFSAGERSERLADSLSSFANRMGSLAPDRKQIATSAKSLQAELDALAVELASRDAPGPTGVLAALNRATTMPADGGATWEATAQRYLAVAAWLQASIDTGALKGEEAKRIRSELEKLCDGLAFHLPGEPKTYASPHRFLPGEMRERWHTLQKKSLDRE